MKTPSNDNTASTPNNRGNNIAVETAHVLALLRSCGMGEGYPLGGVK